MRILIEGYPYDAADVKDVHRGLDILENVNHKVVVNYVWFLGFVEFSTEQHRRELRGES